MTNLSLGRWKNLSDSREGNRFKDFDLMFGWTRDVVSQLSKYSFFVSLFACICISWSASLFFGVFLMQHHHVLYMLFLWCVWCFLPSFVDLLLFLYFYSVFFFGLFSFILYSCWGRWTLRLNPSSLSSLVFSSSPPPPESLMSFVKKWQREKSKEVRGESRGRPKAEQDNQENSSLSEHFLDCSLSFPPSFWFSIPFYPFLIVNEQHIRRRKSVIHITIQFLPFYSPDVI